MLTFVWITLRFIHFASLMLVYGCALYGAWLAPAPIRRLMTRRFFTSATTCRRLERYQRGFYAGDSGRAEWAAAGPIGFFRLGVGRGTANPLLARSGYGKLSSRWSRWRW